MLMFLAGIIAAVAVIILACIFASSSSRSSRHPYAGTPVYHATRQVARFGAATLQVDYLPTTLTTRIEVETSYGCVNFRSSGPPDAVLRGSEQFVSALASGWAVTSGATYPTVDYGQSYPAAGNGPQSYPAVSNGRPVRQLESTYAKSRQRAKYSSK
jgi:hypothetical protein